MVLTENGEARSSSPLFLDGWLEFNRVKWGVTPLRLALSPPGKSLPRLDTVLYLDRHGRVTQPLLNPHLPIAIAVTPTSQPPRIFHQRQEVAALLAEEFLSRGLHGSVCLAPEMEDVREWQWRGFLTDVRYTFHLRLPLDESLIHEKARNRVSRASRAGFVCSIAGSDDIPEVWECIRSTEERQDFRLGLTREDLVLASRLLGPDHFRVYACRAAESGEIVAAKVALFGGGDEAIGLISCVQQTHMRSGCDQQLTAYHLADLASLGVTLYDYVGANLPGVSAAKRQWGGRLVPYYGIRRSTPERAYLKAHDTANRALRRVGLR